VKTKLVTVALVAILALTLTGAALPPAKLVEVGKCYVISTGAMLIKGKVVSEIGDGWFWIAPSNLSTKEPVAVNIRQAFWIQQER